MLLKYGANINSQNEHGQTLLAKAVALQEYNLTTFLVENGADLEIPNAKNQTPLHIATENTNLSTRLIKCLIDHGAKIDVIDASGKTPLILAIEKDSFA